MGGGGGKEKEPLQHICVTSSHAPFPILLLVKIVFFCSDFRYESNGIFVLGVGFFFLQTNFDFLTSHF